MTRNAVMLDTSFFLRFLNVNNPLFSNADGYYRYFLDHEIDMVISTISIAEYCVRGDINELPLRHLKIIPFNVNHAKKAGEFARIVFQLKDELKLTQRKIIPNDTNLFAQADVESSVQYYLTTDQESFKTPRFHFIDMKIPFSETFGVLDL
jgi:predicted nucleic acid-binding protein